jgi:hypothetical protein
MKYFLSAMIISLFIFSCTGENEEEYYSSDTDGDTSNVSGSLIAHIPVDGDVTDITGRTLLTFFGDMSFTQGIDGNPQGAVTLNGENNFILAFIDKYDSISISMWFLRDAEIEEPYTPTLIDYSSDQVTAYLDGGSGATYIVTGMDGIENTSDTWINSFLDWNHLYIEITSNKVNVTYQGQTPVEGLLDFTEVLTPAAPLNFMGDQLYIGRSSEGINLSDTYFDGAIDDIRVYNRFLTTAEINELRSERIAN